MDSFLLDSWFTATIFLTKEYVTPSKVRRLKLAFSAKKEASKVARKIRPKLVTAEKEASILADTPSRRDDIREEPYF